MDDKFDFPIGIELTYIHRNWNERFSYYEEHVIDRTERKLKQAKIPYLDCDVDEHCMEISTKKIYSMSQAEELYKQITEITKSEKCYPWHPDVVSGGGHIHVGLPRGKYRKARFVYNAINMFIKRPYLNWVFNDPDDIYINSRKLSVLEKDIVYLKDLFGNNLQLPTSNSIFTSKEFPINYSHYGTLEFRLFQSPKNWQEQKEHIEFVMAFMHRAWYDAGDTHFSDLSYFYDTNRLIRYDFYRYNFLSFVSSLGLDEKKYAKYCTRNMKQRFEYLTNAKDDKQAKDIRRNYLI